MGTAAGAGTTRGIHHPYPHYIKHRSNKSIAEFIDNNFSLDRTIKTALSGLKPTIQWLLMEPPRNEDKELIADFILNWAVESEYGAPMPPNTKKVYVTSLVYLGRYFDHQKSFAEMTKQDIVDNYLNSLRKL